MPYYQSASLQCLVFIGNCQVPMKSHTGIAQNKTNKKYFVYPQLDACSFKQLDTKSKTDFRPFFRSVPVVKRIRLTTYLL